MSEKRLWLRFTRFVPLVLLAAFAAGCAAPQGGQAEAPGAQPLTETISVTGFGEATGLPDMATIQLGVEVEAASVVEAIERSNQTVDAVRQAILGMGIAETDVQSTNFNTWREDQFDRATGQPTGEVIYHVDSTLMIQVRNIGQVSEVIQTGLDAGANNVFGLTFGIDDTVALEAEARAAALQDARDRAEQLASALGVTLREPLVASELAGGGISPFVAEAALVRSVGLGGGGGGPPLSPGELTVRIQVDVVYAIER